MENSKSFSTSRRLFVKHVVASSVLLGGVSLFGNQLFASGNNVPIKRFHISLQEEAWLKHPELIHIMKEAGITDVWMATYLQGKWYKTPEKLRKTADFLIENGLKPHVLTVPLGHPGNAIDPNNSSWSEKKKTWKNACDYDGSLYSGTSIHDTVIQDNIEAHKLLEKEGFDTVFLDDDFRLAKYPGKIGGCFCNDCKKDFLSSYNYHLNDWEVLISSIEKRNPTKVLRSWVDYICDKEYNMFVALQNATPEMEVGIMVMYLGSEKAGIDLNKYKNVPFRVGEMMFGDKSFGKIKGKTDELFSALFHKRFIKPELAYSESTTYPEDALSAKNMAAKLNVSLISDVRNTMFMSGLNPFPIEYWKVLSPAMKNNAQIHQAIAGHKPKGPLKHFWGWESRLLGEDKPFSLFLALGIPFEVVDEIPDEGWVFLSNEDATAFDKGRIQSKNKNLVVRNEAKVKGERFIQINETLEVLFALKKSILPFLKDIPYVRENLPVIFSWYPSANKALLWNVGEENQKFTIILNDKIIKNVKLNGLDIALIQI